MLNYLFIASTRCPRKDTKVGNYTISAGTIVFPNLYSMTTGYSLLEWLIFLSINLKYKMRLETEIVSTNCLKFRGSKLSALFHSILNSLYKTEYWILTLKYPGGQI